MEPFERNFHAFHISSSIILEGRIKDVSYPLKQLNFYGPYKERVPFWKLLENNGFLNEDNIIIGGDLILTLFYGEIWGTEQY
jgi:hypothetical protein